MKKLNLLLSPQAIMINGEFKCLGSTRHLINKFGEGLVLTLKMQRIPPRGNKVNNVEAAELSERKKLLKDFIKIRLKNSVLK
jgi:ATP-binding cassette, subfamily A (ABC1), member 3